MYKAVIIWETRSGRTEAIAKAIEIGLREQGIEVISMRTMNVEVEELVNYDAILLGSPTYNTDIVSAMKDVLVEMQEVDLKGKVGAAFGSFGWSGESIQILTDRMKNDYRMDVIEPGLKMHGALRLSEPDSDICKAFARIIADRIAGKQ
ncbi:MAG: flavodoxin domain-containing protein [Dehalococcoidales bacterium]|nr:flavodoxin domain-containing protein [Dehalococcoidales bacterium]